MIVNLRGTNGSGKSTAVRRMLIEHGGWRPEGTRPPLWNWAAVTGCDPENNKGPDVSTASRRGLNE